MFASVAIVALDALLVVSRITFLLEHKVNFCSSINTRAEMFFMGRLYLHRS